MMKTIAVIRFHYFRDLDSDCNRQLSSSNTHPYVLSALNAIHKEILLEKCTNFFDGCGYASGKSNKNKADRHPTNHINHNYDEKSGNQIDIFPVTFALSSIAF